MPTSGLVQRTRQGFNPSSVINVSETPFPWTYAVLQGGNPSSGPSAPWLWRTPTLVSDDKDLVIQQPIVLPRSSSVIGGLDQSHCSLSHPLRLRFMPEDPEQSIRQAICIFGGNQEPRDAIGHYLRNVPDRSGDDRKAHGHRLQQAEGESFTVGRKDEQVGSRKASSGVASVSQE